MRKWSMALPLLVFSFSVSQQAVANSSVVLYGRVDLGVSYSKDPTKANTDYDFSMSEGSRGRWGLKGSEDLGGGLTTFFQLEQRFYANTGEQDSDIFWKDKAWLGVAHAEWGSIRLGRMSSPINDGGVNGRFEAFDGNTLAGQGGRGAAQVSKWDNTIYYRSPSLRGFKFGIATSLRPETKDVYGFQGEYAYQRFLGSVAWQRDNKKNSLGRLEQWYSYSVAARYNFNVVHLMGIYAQSRNLGAEQKGKEDTYTVGFIVPVKTGQIRTSFQHKNKKHGVDSHQDEKRNRLGVGYYYPFSKATSLNMSWVYDRYRKGTMKTTGGGMEITLRKNF